MPRHGLRPGSRADAAFVEQECEKLGISCHVKHEQGPQPGQNVESWGRTARYRFFAEVMQERSLDVVLTAHNANDVAETLLMRLLANKEMRTIARRDERRRCTRPFLEVSRKTIDEYNRDHGVVFIDDESNNDLSFLRNKIRHRLIPFLEDEFDPRIVEVLALRALSLDEDEEALALIAEEASRPLEGRGVEEDGWPGLFREAGSQYPPAVRWRMIERLFLPILGFKPGRFHAKEALDILWRKREGMEFPGGTRLNRSHGRLKLR